ncbi:MAG: site-2 protease family protein [Verrucomicrobia bacterium]|nr:site-2 protease family protein [Verrucomicrobiota bacterium]
MSSTKIAEVRGIPIRVHITLWIVLPFFVLQFAQITPGAGSLFWGLLAAVGLFTSVALHELGHSIVAIALGCRVREILLLPIGGVAQLDHMPTRPRDEFMIAIAGPAVSLALSGIFIVLWNLAALMTATALGHVFLSLGMINLILALFNLLPSFPMDGGRIFRAWMTPRKGRVEATRIAAKTGRILAVIFGIIGLFKFNLIWVAIAVFIYMAAGAEYRAVVIQDRFQHSPFTPWTKATPPPLSDDQIYVSPPPYARKQKRSLFDDLFNQFKS